MSKKIYTKELLIEAATNSTNFSELCRLLGCPTSGNSYQRIRKLINDFNIDVSHFKHNTYKGNSPKNKKHFSEILTNGHEDRLRSKQIRRALIESGKDYKCEICKISTWLGNKITLDVDHINGNRLDSRIQNLRFLCPNCHRQETEKLKNYNKCNNCNKKVARKSKHCKRCSRLLDLSRRKVKTRPTKEKLIEQIKEFGYVGTGKIYGVSDNCIRKWLS